MRQTILFLIFLSVGYSTFGLSNVSQDSFVDKSSKHGLLLVTIPPLKYEDASLFNDNANKQKYRVFVREKSKEKEIPYLKDGKYQIRLKEGVYNIRLENMNRTQNEYKRAKFIIRANQSTKIQIFGENAELCDANGFLLWTIYSHGPDLRETASLPKYYSKLIFSHLDIVVKYCRQTNSRNGNSFKFARLTFNNILVVADDISIDLKRRVIKATSTKRKGVYFTNGEKRVEIDKLTLSLKLNGNVSLIQK